jgi:hypothetical protein
MWPLNMAIGYQEGMKNQLKISLGARAGLSANPVSPLRAIAARMDNCIVTLQFAHIWVA